MKKSTTNFLTFCTRSTVQDYPSVEEFYQAVIEELEESEFAPRWNLDLYPSREFLKKACTEACFWLLKEKETGEILAAMIVDQHCEPGYEKADWLKEFSEKQIGYIHLLAVRKKANGKGLARKLMESALQEIKKEGIQTIRLDVIDGNTPALSVYPKLGFNRIDKIPLYYEDTGLMEFTLFERLL